MGEPLKADPARHIVIAGAITNDWFTFPQDDSRDLDSDPWRDKTTGVADRKGGVALLDRFLRNSTAVPHHKIIGPPEDQLEDHRSARLVHAIVDMIEADGWNEGDRKMKVECLRRVANQKSLFYFARDAAQRAPHPACLLLVDSSNGFVDYSGGLSLLHAMKPRYVLFKMARPLALGHLWDEVRLGPMIENMKRDPDRVVVVVNAEDLRAEGIELSRHLSWEKAAEDFIRQFRSNGRLDTLVTCAHLIVRFGCDGVIHHRGRTDRPPVLYFDPECAEGEFVEGHLGNMIGLTTVFCAGLCLGLVEDPNNGVELGIKYGFAAARRLATKGFHISEVDHAPDYPFGQIMPDLQPDHRLASVEIPSKRLSVPGSSWSIIEETMGEASEVARHIVQIGPTAALARVPTARFGQLITADRTEIEGFRAITNLLGEYFRKPQNKPLCVGVFGPHGSGKAYAAMQVADRAAQGHKVVKRQFNLSQFTDLETLTATFQSIRNFVLAGKTPMVFFDTFDAGFGMPLGWLRYFINPMQRGKFLDKGLEHSLGGAVFFFIASSYPTFSDFAKPLDDGEDSDDRKAFYAAKAPDFISGLRGYMDILGSDCRDPKKDRMYPVRRALLLRALLEIREPNLKIGERILIDDAVLNGLLSIPRYRHGARSLEMILAMCTVSGKREFERAALPAESQLNLHVNAEEFMKLVRYPRLPEKLRERIARELHAVYCAERRKMAANETELKTLQRSGTTFDWDDLEEQHQESTRNQADDIPHKLRMINCYMAKDTRSARQPVKKFTEEELEKLAEREHERWNAERLQRQWTIGTEASALRRPSYLTPWRDLEKRWKLVDRAMVECIPDILKMEGVGYQIYRLGTGGR